MYASITLRWFSEWATVLAMESCNIVVSFDSAELKCFNRGCWLRDVDYVYWFSWEEAIKMYPGEHLQQRIGANKRNGVCYSYKDKKCSFVEEWCSVKLANSGLEGNSIHLPWLCGGEFEELARSKTWVRDYRIECTGSTCGYLPSRLNVIKLPDDSKRTTDNRDNYVAWMYRLYVDHRKYEDALADLKSAAKRVNYTYSKQE